MKKMYIIILAMMLFAGLKSYAQNTLNVPGDYATIQAAIDAAVDNDMVLVAEGTYYENINFLGKAITVTSEFFLDGDTSHIFNTIIDGSQYTDDANASTVSMKSGEDTISVLNGFTITGGAGTNFTSGMSWRGGGGVFIKGSGGKITNNIIRDNHIEHTSRESSGIGIMAFVYNNHTAIIRDNVIRNNQGTGYSGSGAGITGIGGRIIIEGNIIMNNTINTDEWAWGGGIYHLATTTTLSGIIEEVVISRNKIHDNKSLSSNNRGRGGGIVLYDGFAENKVEIINNLVYNNQTTVKGGGISISANGAKVINNTIFNNIAGQLGNSIYYTLPANRQAIFLNNIIWSDANNGVSNIELRNSGHKYFYFNLIGGSISDQGYLIADNNLFIRPVFKTDSTFDLAYNSPGIGWGTDSIQVDENWYYAPETDYNRNDRPCVTTTDLLVDVGAIESDYPAFEFTRVPEDYSTIQSAIEAAPQRGIVLVAEGEYFENINFLGRKITVASEYILDLDRTHIENTIIDGSNATNPDSASVVIMESGEDTTSVLMGLTITGGTGSMITSNWFGTQYTDLSGGGIVILNSGGKIENNIIEGNNPVAATTGGVVVFGGGIYANVNNNHTAIIRNNTIRDNNETVDWAYGGGACLVGGRIIFENNTITNNTLNATGYACGAGLFWSDWGDVDVITESVIRNNIIAFNVGNSTNAEGTGGGICLGMPYADNTQVRIYNNIVYDNYTEGKGGAFYSWGDASVINNTLWNNKATVDGNGFYTDEGSSTIFINNIIWSNADTSIVEYNINSASNVEAHYNILKEDLFDGLSASTSNNFYGLEPRFTTDSSFRLGFNSNGIGWGIDSIEIDGKSYSAPPTDCEGHERPCTCTAPDQFVDIGAFESKYRKIPTSVEENYGIDLDLSIYPNPMNNYTFIEFNIKENVLVNLSLFDLQGREIETILNKQLPPDTYTLNFNAGMLESGIYYLHLQKGAKHVVKKMVVVK